LRESRGKSLSSSRKSWLFVEGKARTFQGQLHSRRSLGGGGGGLTPWLNETGRGGAPPQPRSGRKTRPAPQKRPHRILPLAGAPSRLARQNAPHHALQLFHAPLSPRFTPRSAPPRAHAAPGARLALSFLFYGCAAVSGCQPSTPPPWPARGKLGGHRAPCVAELPWCTRTRARSRPRCRGSSRCSRRT